MFTTIALVAVAALLGLSLLVYLAVRVPVETLRIRGRVTRWADFEIEVKAPRRGPGPPRLPPGTTL